MTIKFDEPTMQWVIDYDARTGWKVLGGPAVTNLKVVPRYVYDDAVQINHDLVRRTAQLQTDLTHARAAAMLAEQQVDTLLKTIERSYLWRSLDAFFSFLARKKR